MGKNIRNHDVPNWVGWLFIALAFAMIMFTVATGR